MLYVSLNVFVCIGCIVDCVHVCVFNVFVDSLVFLRVGRVQPITMV